MSFKLVECLWQWCVAVNVTVVSDSLSLFFLSHMCTVLHLDIIRGFFIHQLM